MEETDAAVVVSGEQNDQERLKQLGLEIIKHRKLMVKEDLVTLFINTFMTSITDQESLYSSS